MTERETPNQQDGDRGEPTGEFTDEAPTPPSGLSIEARQWQQSDEEDVQELDFNRFRSDR